MIMSGRNAVIMYTYINRNAGTPNKTNTKKYMMSLDYIIINYNLLHWVQDWMGVDENNLLLIVIIITLILFA